MSSDAHDFTSPPEHAVAWASAALRDNLSTVSAPTLLLTILGELVLPLDSPVWTSTLLYLLKGLGVEEKNARQTIARAAESGVIAGERRGRLARWSVTDAGIELINESTRRVRSLSTKPQRWDELCLILIVSVPQHQKAVRKRLYSALSWAGFGNPAPGIWASPHADRADEMRKIIEELNLQDSSFAFLGHTVSAGLTDAEIVQRAWDLESVARRYENVIDLFEGLAPDVGDPLLFTYLALANEWRQFPSIDPQLPHDLLPDWVGHRATELLLGLYMKWSDGAFRRWQEIVELASADKQLQRCVGMDPA